MSLALVKRNVSHPFSLFIIIVIIIDEFTFMLFMMIAIRVRPTTTSLSRLLAEQEQAAVSDDEDENDETSPQVSRSTDNGLDVAVTLTRARSAISLTPALVTRVKASLLRLRAGAPNETFFPLSAVVAEVNEQANESDLSLPEIEAVLLHMESQNMLMYRDQFVIFL